MSKGRVKHNMIVGPFIPHRLDILESAAWGSLSLAARRVLDRFEIEHLHHGGAENGQLLCTYSDLERFGVRRKSVSGAISELVKAGFVEVTHHGRGGNMVYRNPSRYRLTYLATRNAAATDEWKNAKPGAKLPPTQGAKTPPTEQFFGGERAPSALVAKAPLPSISWGERERLGPLVEAPVHTERVNYDGEAAGPITVRGALAASAIVTIPRRRAR